MLDFLFQADILFWGFDFPSSFLFLFTFCEQKCSNIICSLFFFLAQFSRFLFLMDSYSHASPHFECTHHLNQGIRLSMNIQEVYEALSTCIPNLMRYVHDVVKHCKVCHVNVHVHVHVYYVSLLKGLCTFCRTKNIMSTDLH